MKGILKKRDGEVRLNDILLQKDESFFREMLLLVQWCVFNGKGDICNAESFILFVCIKEGVTLKRCNMFLMIRFLRHEFFFFNFRNACFTRVIKFNVHDCGWESGSELEFFGVGAIKNDSLSSRV